MSHILSFEKWFVNESTILERSEFLPSIGTNSPDFLKDLKIGDGNASLFDGLGIDYSDSGIYEQIRNINSFYYDVLSYNKKSQVTAEQLFSKQIDYLKGALIGISKNLFDEGSYSLPTYNINSTNFDKSLSIFSEIKESIDNKIASVDLSSFSNKIDKIKGLDLTSDTGIFNKFLNTIQNDLKILNLHPVYEEMDKVTNPDPEELSSSNLKFDIKFYSTDYNVDDLFKSNDPLQRLGSFYERVLLLSNFGKSRYATLKNLKIGSNNWSLPSIKALFPSFSDQTFNIVSKQIDEICSDIIKNIIEKNTDLISGIFTPILQRILIACIALSIFKYIFSKDITSTKEIVQDDKEINKIQKENLSKKDKIKSLYKIFELMDKYKFFTSNELYSIKNINKQKNNIRLLKAILYLLNFYKNSKDLTSDTFNNELTQAIKEFQKTYGGIKVDGIVGPETKKAFSIVRDSITTKYPDVDEIEEEDSDIKTVDNKESKIEKSNII